MVPRKQAGHMTCTRPQAERQILLATRASSTHDPKRKSCQQGNLIPKRTLRYSMASEFLDPLLHWSHPLRGRFCHHLDKILAIACERNQVVWIEDIPLN